MMVQAAAWTTEPDRKDWEAHGLKCAIRRVRDAGHLCGYVGIPKEHPLHGVGYYDECPALEPLREQVRYAPNDEGISPEMALEVHGGITYSDNHVAGGKPDGLWWFGFDCAHSGDLSPGLQSHLRDAGAFTSLLGGEYRDMAYVTRETENLAKQLCSLKEGIQDAR